MNQSRESCSTFRFKPIGSDDLELLHSWLNAPHVSERWGGPASKEVVRQKYGSRINTSTVFSYVTYWNNEPFGFVQIYNDSASDSPWYSRAGDNAWGIDQFIGEERHLGKGHGARMVTEFLRFAFTKFKPTKIVTDPAPDNLRAIRCFEKAGFTKLKVVSSPDGPAMLMEVTQESVFGAQRHFTGVSWESKVGYCRSIRVGNQIFISGTAPVADDGTVYAPGDAYLQATRCLQIIRSSLEYFQSDISHIVRTRMFVTDIKRWEEYGRAHQEVFSDHPPATTMVEVKALIDPKMLIEIEADAILE
jgi:enamine deaminase RidA (YjgF/YER057c/UK114 family)